MKTINDSRDRLQLIVVLVITLGCANNDTPPTSDVKEVHLERDLGVIVADRSVPIRESFQLLNPTDEPATLRLVRRSCSCSGFYCEPPIVPARSSATLTVTANAPPTGSHDFDLELASTTEHQFKVAVSIHTLIAPPIRISELSESLVTIEPEGTASFRFTIESYAESPWPESACHIDQSGQLQVRVLSHATSRLGVIFHQRWECEGIIKPRQDGELSGVVLLGAGFGDGKTEWPLRWRRTSPIVAQPERLIFHDHSPADEGTVVELIGSIPFELPSLEGISQDFELTQSPSADVHRRRLAIRWRNKELTPGIYELVILIKSDQQSSVRVKLVVLRSRRMDAPTAASGASDSQPCRAGSIGRDGLATHGSAGGTGPTTLRVPPRPVR